MANVPLGTVENLNLGIPNHFNNVEGLIVAGAILVAGGAIEFAKTMRERTIAGH